MCTNLPLQEEMCVCVSVYQGAHTTPRAHMPASTKKMVWCTAYLGAAWVAALSPARPEPGRCISSVCTWHSREHTSYRSVSIFLASFLVFQVSVPTHPVHGLQIHFHLTVVLVDETEGT